MKEHAAFFTGLLSASLLFTIPSAFPAGAEPAPGTEEIIVNAPENLRRFRVEIDRAQEAMFNVFNALNGDDKFDVHCEYVRRWQSKIRQQVCSPVYLKIAQEEEAEMLMGAFGVAGSTRGAPGLMQMNHYNGQFEEVMKNIFEEHAEFREALNEYQTLAESLEEVRRERFGLDD